MENKKQIIISDCTLRDGNHAIKHQLSLDSIAKYCKFADEAKIPIIEVGHGIGLGASSLLIGQSKHSDKEMLETARQNLKTSKLGVHICPGIATIEKDIKPAIEIGVDVFRIASHCTEASITKSHIEFLRSENKNVYGVLMMSALVDYPTLIQEARKMVEYGAEGIMLMDSTGTYLPIDVYQKVYNVGCSTNTKMGFHAHNNLGLSTANSLRAVEAGATIIDACMRGFGAGAGNTPLEQIIPILEQSGYSTGIDFDMVIKEADEVMNYLIPKPISHTPLHILTGVNKVLAAFENHILKASKQYSIPYYKLVVAIGNKKLVAGQEDLIYEIAQNLNNGK